MADVITPIINNNANQDNALNSAQASLLANQQFQAGINQGVGEINAKYGQTASLTGPYIMAGAQATNAMTGNINPFVVGGQDAVANLNRIQGAPLDVNAYLDPSMNFSLEQGQKALERSASARGGVLSGAAMQDLASYATGIASQNYNNAAGLALQDRNQRIGIGESLVNSGIAANAQYAPTISAGSNALANQTSSANSAMGDLASLRQAGGANAAQTTNSIANSQNAGNSANAANNAQYAQIGLQAASWIADNWDSVSSWFSDEDMKQNIKPARAASLNILNTLDDLYASDENCKKDISNLSKAEINKSLDGMNAKTYEYTPEARAAHPTKTMPGKQVGIIAQDVEKTPAGDMVSTTEDGKRMINIPKATSFALAALSALGDRVKALEARK